MAFKNICVLGTVGFAIVAYCLSATEIATKIQNLHVPDVVKCGTENITLWCQYTTKADIYTVKWFFNKIQIYEWNPRTGLKIENKFKERLNIPELPSAVKKESALRLQPASPDMSGNYTCRISSELGHAEHTKNMLVFSSENDFELNIQRLYDKHCIYYEIKCTAGGLHPKPDLTLELNNTPMNQLQRVWSDKNSLYTAESTSILFGWPTRKGTYEITCRLHLPQADYTVIQKKSLRTGNQLGCNASSVSLCSIVVLCISVLTSQVCSI